MKLNFKVFGKGQPILILHGLFGSLDNWQTIAKELAVQFRVFILDQRNHGKSSHAEKHDYLLMANDLAEFCHAQNLENVTVIGHSMGAKTAMQFAISHPELCCKFISIDMAPKRYKAGHEVVFEALFSLDMPQLKSREEAQELLMQKINDEGIVLFLLKNLHRDPVGGFSWKMNLVALHQNYPKMTRAITADFPVSVPCLFINGENSDYFLPEDEDDTLALFPLAQFSTIENAGHWVHVDNARSFIEGVTTFLNND